MEGRRQFKPLTDKLKRLKIKFRWEVPVGLSCFKGKRKMIMDPGGLWKIIREFEKEGISNPEGGEEGEIKA